MPDDVAPRGWVSHIHSYHEPTSPRTATPEGAFIGEIKGIVFTTANKFVARFLYPYSFRSPFSSQVPDLLGPKLSRGFKEAQTVLSKSHQLTASTNRGGTH